MDGEDSDNQFRFAISLSVLNHLGRNLYRNFITVLGEAISNAWDADAKNVWIEIDRDANVFSIKDDGIGMDSRDFQEKFLKIGYSKRANGNLRTAGNRPFIGAKGIGKLALLSCAQRISVITKKIDSDYVGGIIDNTGLDNAIKHDLIPDEYPLEIFDLDSFSDLIKDHEHGTIIAFDGAKEQIRNSISHIRKMIALSFRFTLVDNDFSIFVNGEKIGLEDIRDVLDSTEFVWVINDGDHDIIEHMNNLKAEPTKLVTTLDISGFIASVEKPRNLKITGTEERATIDLFVNGRLREKNLLRHIPTQRVVESYIYGQIHFDRMDSDARSDPFTSSREGVVEDDENFNSLLDYLKREALPQIFDQWDRLRLARGEEGDEDNPRKTKRERRVRDLYTAVRNEFQPEEGAETKDDVESWLNDLRTDAEFNISSYVDCFLSENLLRKYIREYNVSLDKGAPSEIEKWRNQEDTRKAEANISFDIRNGNEDGLSFLGMDLLALSIEGGKKTNGNQSLWRDAVSYKPVRNVVGHTGLLTGQGKTHLTLTFENIKARVKTILAGKPKQ